jgi:phosphate transport system protein
MRLTKEVNRLKRRLLGLSAMVEDSVRRALIAVENHDEALANEVVEDDARVDEAEVELEEECLKVLALHQPVAIDLRYIIAVLKINNDIERIGDLAVNIAKRALDLREAAEVPAVLPEMADKARDMLRTSLDALVDFDGDRARQVLAMDDEVDRMHKAMFDRLDRIVTDEPGRAHDFIPFLSVSRNLERIADLATNIAEDVIYLIDGDIVRHQHAE